MAHDQMGGLPVGKGGYSSPNQVKNAAAGEGFESMGCGFWNYWSRKDYRWTLDKILECQATKCNSEESPKLPCQS